ncbi:MAG: cupredoxin domain-containing protein [Pseudomonadota bacterium]|nr:cupredoxin domain-containing protein [Pseudomonadota bacterium]
MMAGLLASPTYAAEQTVDQTNSRFDPTSVTIKAGDTLRFKNSDAYTHNVTVTSPLGEKTDAGMEKPQEATVAYKFRDPGQYMVRCTIHPMMKLSVTVESDSAMKQ